MPKKLGLPDYMKSKYDNHLVEEITARTRTSIIRNIPIEKLVPNEMQPRKDFGNLEELAESIKEKGILEPILVRSRDGQFEIIAGERRVKAGKLAGLKEIPAIVYDIPDNEALEVSIIENIQRKDLDIFEYAFSLKSLSELYGYTHQDISEKIGKSRVTVTELFRLTDLPPEIVTKCSELNITSKTFLLELVKLDNIEQMWQVLNSYNEKPFSREKIKDQRKEKEIEEKPHDFSNKSTKFNFISEDKSIKINFNIKNKEMGKQRLIEILEKLIADIREDKISDLNLE
ncbi:MAG: ParB/RepB/Spo0J family partition protein, partial [Candidatus Aminicenantes bacterium]|nr:ParB/RepB/Spo0J family partition protein [Candidatus Aminicenantes bacterium]